MEGSGEAGGTHGRRLRASQESNDEFISEDRYAYSSFIDMILINHLLIEEAGSIGPALQETTKIC